LLTSIDLTTILSPLAIIDVQSVAWCH